MNHMVTHLTINDMNREKPIIKISMDKLEILAQVGMVINGSFDIDNIGGGMLRGRIYSSVKHLTLECQSWEGNHTTIHYSYNVTEIYHEKRLQDSLEIASNGGSVRIPIDIRINENIITTSQGNLINLNSFTEYAILNWDAARAIFEQEYFVNFFLHDSKEYTNYYHLSKLNRSLDQGLEEFLVNIKKKKSVSISVKAEDGIQRMVSEIARNTFVVEKDTWGYITGSIWTDSPFVKVVKESFSTKDFTGNRMEVDYFLDPSKMHMGPNDGNIYIETYRGTIVHRISCDKREITKVYLDKLSYNLEERPTLTIENNTGKKMTVTVESKDQSVMSQKQSYQIMETTKIRLQFNLKGRFYTYKMSTTVKKLAHVVNFTVLIQCGTATLKKEFSIPVTGYDLVLY